MLGTPPSSANFAARLAERWGLPWWDVPDSGFTAEDGQRVLDKLAAEVSARVAAQVELVDQIPVLPNGKYKWVVQESRRRYPGGARSSGSLHRPEISV